MAWEIDSANSVIQFKVRHMMVSWVRGQFETFSGSVEVDEDNPENSNVEIQIDSNSIRTRQEDRDAHLRSLDFLSADEYPYITFKNTGLNRTGEHSARLTGDLTIRGVTQDVTLDVTYNGQAPNPLGPIIMAGFSAETTINRKDWGLQWNVPVETGGVAVGDEIQISIELALVKHVEQEAQAVSLL